MGCVLFTTSLYPITTVYGADNLAPPLSLEEKKKFRKSEKSPQKAYDYLFNDHLSLYSQNIFQYLLKEKEEGDQKDEESLIKGQIKDLIATSSDRFQYELLNNEKLVNEFLSTIMNAVCEAYTDNALKIMNGDSTDKADSEGFYSESFYYFMTNFLIMLSVEEKTLEPRKKTINSIYKAYLKKDIPAGDDTVENYIHLIGKLQDYVVDNQFSCLSMFIKTLSTKAKEKAKNHFIKSSDFFTTLDKTKDSLNRGDWKTQENLLDNVYNYFSSRLFLQNKRNSSGKVWTVRTGRAERLFHMLGKMSVQLVNNAYLNINPLNQKSFKENTKDHDTYDRFFKRITLCYENAFFDKDKKKEKNKEQYLYEVFKDIHTLSYGSRKTQETNNDLEYYQNKRIQNFMYDNFHDIDKAFIENNMDSIGEKFFKEKDSEKARHILKERVRHYLLHKKIGYISDQNALTEMLKLVLAPEYNFYDEKADEEALTLYGIDTIIKNKKIPFIKSSNMLKESDYNSLKNVLKIHRHRLFQGLCAYSEQKSTINDTFKQKIREHINFEKGEKIKKINNLFESEKSKEITRFMGFLFNKVKYISNNLLSIQSTEKPLALNYNPIYLSKIQPKSQKEKDLSVMSYTSEALKTLDVEKVKSDAFSALENKTQEIKNKFDENLKNTNNPIESFYNDLNNQISEFKSNENFSNTLKPFVQKFVDSFKEIEKVNEHEDETGGPKRRTAPPSTSTGPSTAPPSNPSAPPPPPPPPPPRASSQKPSTSTTSSTASSSPSSEPTAQPSFLEQIRNKKLRKTNQEASEKEKEEERERQKREQENNNLLQRTIQKAIDKRRTAVDGSDSDDEDSDWDLDDDVKVDNKKNNLKQTTKEKEKSPLSSYDEDEKSDTKEEKEPVTKVEPKFKLDLSKAKKTSIVNSPPEESDRSTTSTYSTSSGSGTNPPFRTQKTLFETPRNNDTDVKKSENFKNIFNMFEKGETSSSFKKGNEKQKPPEKLDPAIKKKLEPLLSKGKK